MARTDIEKAIAQDPLTPLHPEADVDMEEFPIEIEVDLEGEEEEDEELLEVGFEEESFDSNLAEFMEEEDLEVLGSDLLEKFEEDKESREEWESILRDGMDLLGFRLEEREDPFPGASGVSHPLLSQSVVKFQAKAFKELCPTGGPARTRIVGTQSPERLEQARRVKEFLNYQITTEMTEYYTEMDRLLFYVALYGSAFKKTYYDMDLDRPVSEFVKPEDFVIDYFASDLQKAERYTHKYRLSRNKITRYMMAGTFRRVDLIDPEEAQISEIEEEIDELHGRSAPANMDDTHTILEMHVNLDLPGYEHEEGLEVPYIVHLEATDGKILSIRRNWKEEDPKFHKRQSFTHYCFIPGLGFYGYGYLHLIGGLTKTATGTLRQLLDAGTFSTLPAGFKATGLRVLAPDEPLRPGEFREVNAPAGDLSKSLTPLPFRDPSPTLLSLMQFVVETGKEFADNTDQVISESTNYGPVGTTLALLEASGKLYSAIHSRMHRAQAQDLKILTEIDYEYLPPVYPYEIAGGARQAFKQDFDLRSIDVIPVSDPNMPTEAHRVAKLNAIMSLAAQDPAAHNMHEIRMDLYRAMGVEAPERYMAQQQQPISADPLTENAAAITGKAITAQPWMNHDAHIQAHGMLLGNPAYAENQQMRQILMAHINEHLAMKYQTEMLQMLPPELAQAAQQQQGGQLPPELSNAVAQAVADASDIVLQFDEAKARLMQGETLDPVMELQKEELRVKEKQGDQKHIRELGKLKLDEAELMIDDINTDLDREAKIYLDTLKEEGKADATARKALERSSS